MTKLSSHEEWSKYSFGDAVFNFILTVFNYNFNFKNCKHNNNLITYENSNR
jgi:hypothetical protein